MKQPSLAASILLLKKLWRLPFQAMKRNPAIVAEVEPFANEIKVDAISSLLAIPRKKGAARPVCAHG
jgi:hypothetical protein